MQIPPIDFLLESSMRSLEDLLLSSRNRSTNLKKAIRLELDACIEQEALAIVAEWFIKNRDALVVPEVSPKRVELFGVDTFEKSA